LAFFDFLLDLVNLVTFLLRALSIVKIFPKLSLIVFETLIEQLILFVKIIQYLVFGFSNMFTNLIFEILNAADDLLLLLLDMGTNFGGELIPVGKEACERIRRLVANLG